MASRYFYVIYFDDPRVQKCLDAIRFLCNPTEKGRAHITVRGPFTTKKQEETVAHYNQLMEGSIIDITGVDNFFAEGYRTVFLKCNSDEIRRVWKKSDFGYNPHITLYDGNSMEVASELFLKLSGLDLNFRCRADGVHALKSEKGQLSFDLLEAYDTDFVDGLIGEHVDRSSVADMAWRVRLELIERLAQKLKDFDVSKGEPKPRASKIEKRSYNFFTMPVQQPT